MKETAAPLDSAEAILQGFLSWNENGECVISRSELAGVLDTPATPDGSISRLNSLFPPSEYEDAIDYETFLEKFRTETLGPLRQAINNLPTSETRPRSPLAVLKDLAQAAGVPPPEREAYRHPSGYVWGGGSPKGPTLKGPHLDEDEVDVEMEGDILAINIPEEKSPPPPVWERARDPTAPLGFRRGMRFVALERCEPNGKSAGVVEKGEVLTVTRARYSGEDGIAVYFDELDSSCRLYEPGHKQFESSRAAFERSLRFIQ